MSAFEKPVEVERDDPHDPNSTLAPCLCEGCRWDLEHGYKEER